MAEINLAHKYDPKVVERYSIGSITDAYAGKAFDFTGVNGITVWSVDTVPMTDYTPSGTERFGQLVELGDTKQEMLMRKNRSFTFSIDKTNSTQQFNIKAATRSLKREVDEVMTPELDTYRLEQWCSGAGLSAIGSLTKSNVIEAILGAGAGMNNKLVPKKNRALFIKESVFLNVKLADQVIGIDRLGEKAVKNGGVGMLGGMTVVPVPDIYLPENVNFLVKYKDATVDPVKLKTLRILNEQRGVDGEVVEGHIMYDSFVLTAKANGLYVHKTA